MTTRTGFRQKKSASGGLEMIVYSAFAENVQALAAQGMLHKHLLGARTDPSIARKPQPQYPVLTIDTGPKGAQSVSDAVKATVLVMSGDGHGSGFLVSRDGYFLTNQHVVGKAKYVKLRWSDGQESLGEVVRSDKARDVALIKSDSRGQAPIHMTTQPSDIGQEVFAIGAPLDEKLQNTVTKGIFSANRVLESLSFVQSDVSIVPGNSGGPLVLSDGRLVGVAVSGLRINDAPQGVNMFIPAAEAMAWLALSDGKGE